MKQNKTEKNFNKKHLVMLFVNTILLLGAYLVCVRFFPIVTLIIFTVFSTVLVFVYVIYNRGFSRKNLKIETEDVSLKKLQIAAFVSVLSISCLLPRNGTST